MRIKTKFGFLFGCEAVSGRVDPHPGTTSDAAPSPIIFIKFLLLR
jgi:hypothetical protein